MGHDGAMRLRIFVEPQQGASYETLRAAAACAEQAGFDAFFRSDHYVGFGAGDHLPGPTDAWTTLAGLSRDTTTIRLGTLVSPVTFRLPGPLAITVAQVDAMSGGRVELGIGAGWFEAEHAAYGIGFPAVAQRFEMLEEQLGIVTGLWTTPVGETFTVEGRHYSLSASPALPKPVQQPHPPIIMGGGGTMRTPALAARFASEFNAFLGVDDAASQYRRVDEACARIGRDPATLARSFAITVCCGEDDDAVEQRANAAGWQVADLKRVGACGTPEQVAARLAAFAEIGATTAYLQLPDPQDLSHIELLGATLPALTA